MKGLLLIVVLSMLALVPPPASAQAKKGGDASDYGQRDLFDGETEYWVSDFVGSEAEQKKKALLVSFCASFCKPCWKELPLLLELKKKYGERGFELWSVLVDQDNEGRDIGKKKLQPAKGKAVCTRMAGRRMADEYMGRKWEMPALFLIDGKGKIVEVLKGLDKGGLKRLENKLKDLLDIR